MIRFLTNIRYDRVAWPKGVINSGIMDEARELNPANGHPFRQIKLLENSLKLKLNGGIPFIFANCFDVSTCSAQ